MARTYTQLLDQPLQNNFLQRQEAWTESIAVGSKEFISKIKRTLASKAIGGGMFMKETGCLNFGSHLFLTVPILIPKRMF